MYVVRMCVVRMYVVRMCVVRMYVVRMYVLLVLVVFRTHVQHMVQHVMQPTMYYVL